MIKSKIAGKQFFIHNSLGAFYKGLLNWFGDQFYDRLEYKVIGTYEKSVEFFNKKIEFEKEIEVNMTPSISLDPSYNIEFSDGIGRTMWQKPYHAPGLAAKLWNPVEGLEDQGLFLSIIHTRFKGEMEITFWLESVYELLDMRTELLLFSGGLDRYMRPKRFDSYIVMPQEIIEYDLNGTTIDWTKTPLAIKLLQTVNKYKYTLPVTMDPMFKFTSISDNSEKYGGDDIASYKISCNIEYEINLPTYVVLHTDLGGRLELSFQVDAAFSKYGTRPIFDEEINEYVSTPEHFVNKVRFKKDEYGNTHAIEQIVDYAYYTFTDQDVIDYPNMLVIPNPFIDADFNKLRFISYGGDMDYESEWVETDKTKEFIEIKLKPISGENVEIHKYGDIPT